MSCQQVLGTCNNRIEHKAHNIILDCVKTQCVQISSTVCISKPAMGLLQRGEQKRATEVMQQPLVEERLNSWEPSKQGQKAQKDTESQAEWVEGKRNRSVPG